jgi:MOSC domain-containing protein YiiM
MHGIVRALNISTKKGVIKTPIERAVFLVEEGMEGDAHSGPGKRQVSLLAQESVNKMIQATGLTNLTEGIFAENITTEGLELHTLPVGTRLQIGETLHEVSQIGKECHSGCEIMPKEGIFTRVLVGGAVQPGDRIEVLENEPVL